MTRVARAKSPRRAERPAGNVPQTARSGSAKGLGPQRQPRRGGAKARALGTLGARMACWPRSVNPQRQRLIDEQDRLEALIGLAAAGPPTAGRYSFGQAMQLANGNRRLAAKYDSAATTDDNRKHWGQADALAADAAGSPNIRAILRNRARYEVANNSYAKGIVETIAGDVIGTGPRLQLLTDDDAVNERVEAQFSAWMRAANLSEKLRVMRKARCQDGEAFALMTTNPALGHPVKLDLRLIEADQVRAGDFGQLGTAASVDGIEYDAAGNPAWYTILRVHPGYGGFGLGVAAIPWQYDRWPARDVLHWYRMDRPGQHRGLPEILAALPLYALLRRYTLATLQAAESAADFAIVLKTQSGAGDLGQDEIDSEGNVAPTVGESFPLQSNMVTVLPDNYDINQTKPEQPATTYPQFKREIVAESGRCQNVPYNVAAGDSSDSSFASGRLDHQVYFRTIDIDRDDCGNKVLDRLLAAWLDEAALVSDAGDGRPYLPQALRTVRREELPHTWHWVGHEYGNRQQEANAVLTGLEDGTTTHAIEYAKRGLDWQRAFVSAARALGVTVEEYQSLLRRKLFAIGAAKAPANEENPDALPK